MMMSEVIGLIKRDLENLNAQVQKFYKEVEIEKGSILTEDYLIQHESLFQKYANFFTAYPDIFIDLITPEDSNFSLFFFQRIFLRACMRYRYHYCTACRAFSKTFISILALYLECMFRPGAKLFICAPGKNQSAKIAKDKIYEIWDKLPFLKKEIVGEGNFGKDYVTLTFRNGSIFDVVGALDSERGGRRSGGLIDEVRDHDGEILNSVVLPLMNVSRRMPNGETNENEPNQQQLYMTSAGVKSSYAYEKLIDCFTMSIINPKKAFVWGCDYRVPVLHGLLEKQFIQELKMSPTYQEEVFAREYLSVWSGGSEESWFNFDKLQKYRKIKNPEKHAKFRAGSEQFYLLSVDVGRLHDQTVCCVFRVNIINEKYYSTLVNIFVLGRQAETKTFVQQAVDLKCIIRDFQPREVVIDTNGLGIGLADEMIRTHYDFEGNLLPSYGFFNDSDYKKIQPKDSINILYSMKANGPLNSKIHGNAYSRINGGLVRFLIKEQEAKNALLATKKGQKMSIEDKIKRLMPHEMTTKLFEEMANLRLKRTGTGLDIILEQINPRFPKDKYSAFAYGQYRIKEIEEEASKRNRRRFGSSNGKKRSLVFYSSGGY